MSGEALLSVVASIISIGSMLSMIIGKDKNIEIFNALVSHKEVDRSFGHSTSTFLEATIFNFFKNKPFSLRSILLSSIISVLVIILLISFCWYFSAVVDSSKEGLSASLFQKKTVVSSFFEPWHIDSWKDVVAIFFALAILIISDYISFLQSYFLLKLAKNTLSIKNIIFIAWIDIAITFFSSMFVVSAILMVLFIKIQTSNLQFVTISRPAIFNQYKQGSNSIGDLVSGVSHAIAPDLDLNGASYYPIITSTSLVIPNGQYEDRDLNKIIKTYQRDDLAGVLLDPFYWQIVNDNPAYLKMITGKILSDGFCRIAPAQVWHKNKLFYLSAAGSGMAPLFFKANLTNPLALLANNSISKEVFGTQFSGHSFLTDSGYVALVEQVDPWEHMTLKKLSFLLWAGYSLGFRKMQEFQNDLPFLNYTVPFAKGTFCDLREQYYIFDRDHKFESIIGGEGSSHLEEMRLATIISPLISEEYAWDSGLNNVTICNPGQLDLNSSLTFHQTSDDPLQMAAKGEQLCAGNEYLWVMRSANSASTAQSRLASAEFTMLNSTHIILFPLVIGSVGLTLVFYVLLACFVTMKLCVNWMLKLIPRILPLIQHTSFQDNTLAIIIFLPTTIIALCVYLSVAIK